MGQDGFAYAGARALVLLHEQELRRFLECWERADAAGVTLPVTDDPAYASRLDLLRHVLGAARGYMVWICEQLQLPDAGIERLGEGAPATEQERRAYLEHVLEGWRTALASVPGERFDRPEYPSRWGVLYCIDAMLEHAVMHPLRHRFQLEELLAAQGG